MSGNKKNVVKSKCNNYQSTLSLNDPSFYNKIQDTDYILKKKYDS